MLILTHRALCKPSTQLHLSQHQVAKEGLFLNDTMAVSSQREPKCCPSQKWGAPDLSPSLPSALLDPVRIETTLAHITGAKGKRVEPRAGLGFQFA